MKDSRWQWIGVGLAAALVVPGFFLTPPVEHRPGFRVTLAALTPSGSSTTLRYQASVSGTDRIDPKDFFRIADLPGLVAGSAEAPPGWSVTTEPSSRPEPGAGSRRGDDPTLPNLVFTYEGPIPILGPVLVKGFSARSTSGSPRADRGFVGLSTRATRPGEGTKVASAGDVARPGAVPEPASLFSSCLGVIILGVVYAQRHRRKLRVLA